MAAGTAARTAALQILRRVREGRRFAAALEEAVAPLAVNDRRLAHEIAAGILREREELDRLIAPLTMGRWSRLTPDLQDLLRIGAYQLTKLERVPQYAALSATVETAKTVAGVRGSGLVNAVLRRLGAMGGRGTPGAAPSGLAQRYSHPRWLVERWLPRFGPERTEALLRHNNTRPPLVLQPLREGKEQLRDLLTGAGIASRDAPLGAGLVVAASRVRALPGFAAGAFLVQDPAQAKLLAYAAIPRDALIWDACAAPGGKATVLGTGGRRLIASDVSSARLELVRETVTRAGARVSLFVADARRPPLRRGRVDVVLVDAPCSATGTMARHPDARWRLSAAHIRRLADRQAAILDGVATVLGAGGLLIYLTCSLEPEENEEQVDRFLNGHPEFRRDADDCAIFPADAGTDGGFGARLRRVT